MKTQGYNKHYVIFGGAGYVGIFLIHALINKYDDVKITVITKNVTKSIFFRYDNVQLFDDVNQIKNEKLTIINLAYSIGDQYSDTKKQNKIIVDNIANVIENNNVDKIIHVSSIVLSLNKKNWNSVNLVKNNTYYFAKSYAEKKLINISNKTKVPVAIVRSGNILGPGSPWVNQIIKRLSENQPITGDKLNYPSNSTYVGNLSEIIISLSNYDKLQTMVMNCCEFGNISWKDWIDSINQSFNYEVKKWSVKSVNELKPAFSTDMKHIIKTMIANIVPLMYKGRYTNNLVIKILDFLNIKGAKSKMKLRLNRNVGNDLEYIDLTEYDMIKVFMNEESFGLENMPEEISSSIPFDFNYTMKSINNWLDYSGYVYMK